VAEFHARRVEWDGAGLFDNLLDLASRDEQELGLVVNKTNNQPGTGNTVHMDMRTRDPKHVFLLLENGCKMIIRPILSTRGLK
jgi:hypothetical protein